MESLEFQIDPTKKINLHRELDVVASYIISAYLRGGDGTVKSTSEMVGVSRTTLHEMMKRLGLLHLKRKKRGDHSNEKSNQKSCKT